MLLGAPALFFSCSDDTVIDDKTESEKEPAEIIIPVDFRYLTLNKEGSYSGQKPSISFIHKNGTVYADYYNTVNGEQVLCDPNAAFHFKDKVILAYGSNWNDNGISVLEGNSFKKVDFLNLNRAMTPHAIEWLGGDSLLVAGRSIEDDSNAFILDISGLSEIKRKIDFGFMIFAMRQVKNKIFVFGDESRYPNNGLYPNLVVMDINNLHESAMRIIKKNIRISSKNSSPCLDKNGNLWFAGEEWIEDENKSGYSGYRLYCIDTAKETITHTLKMPKTISTLNELAFAISNDGQTIYLRNHKAFYTVDVDSPTELDEPVYEFLSHVGSLCDLKMTKEGTLLFINQIQTPNIPSEVFEVRPDDKGWKLIGSTKVGESAKSIYMSKYEK